MPFAATNLRTRVALLLLLGRALSADGFSMQRPTGNDAKSFIPRSASFTLGMQVQAQENEALGGVVAGDVEVQSRRRALASLLACAVAAVGASGASSPPVAAALDMDSFASAELESDTAKCDPKKDPKCKPKLSSDEALCQYGQSGSARGEACKRVKSQGGQVPTKSKEKSPGGAYAT